MDELESKMGAILNNPEMMQKIMTMAQSLNTSNKANEPPQEETSQPLQTGFPNIDLGAMQKLAGLAGQSKIDKNQQSLLRALGPYLNRERISKLEKAMRAAKMASMASSLLGNSGFLSGR